MRRLIAATYFICAVTVIIFALIFLSQSSYILFSDADLQLELYELASIGLAWAFLPMTLATILFRKVNKRRGKLIFLPMIISFGFFAFWFAMLLLGVVWIG